MAERSLLRRRVLYCQLAPDLENRPYSCTKDTSTRRIRLPVFPAPVHVLRFGKCLVTFMAPERLADKSPGKLLPGVLFHCGISE